MKKTIYIAPQTVVYMLQGQELLNSISSLSSTNTDGLGISSDAYEDDVRVKEDRGGWGDEW